MTDSCLQTRGPLFYRHNLLHDFRVPTNLCMITFYKTLDKPDTNIVFSEYTCAQQSYPPAYFKYFPQINKYINIACGEKR